MLDRSSKFATLSERIGLQNDVIVAITKSGTTYYFATRPMPRGLNTPPIYPILLTSKLNSENIDIYTKQWQVSDVTITLINKDFYPQTNSTPINTATLLENANGANCKIYRWIEGITDIADCLKVFEGQILQTPDVTKDTIKIIIYDKGKLLDKKIPSQTVGDLYSQAPTNVKTQPAPIVYGSFYGGNILQGTHPGLAKAIRVSNDQYPYYLVAGHAVKSLGIPYTNVGGTIVMPMTPSTNNVDDSGKAWINITSGAQSQVEFSLNGTDDPSEYYDDGVYQVANPANINIWMANCTLKDNVSDDGTWAIGRALWRIVQDRDLLAHMKAGGTITVLYSNLQDTTDFSESQISYIHFYIYYGRDGDADERVKFGVLNVSPGDGESAFDLFLIKWHMKRLPIETLAVTIFQLTHMDNA